MKPKIKRTKQPDRLEYRGKLVEVLSSEKNDTDYPVIIVQNNFRNKIKWHSGTIMTFPQAKELSKVLPKFLEEIETK